MGYLICDRCGGYYELQYGESPKDFSDECDCGGKLIYSESLGSAYEDFSDPVTKITCPYCGAENPEDKTLCQSCKRFLKPIKTPSNMAKFSQTYTRESSENPQENESKWGIAIVSIFIVVLINIIVLFGTHFSVKTSSGITIYPYASTVEFLLSKYPMIRAIAPISLTILGLISMIIKNRD